MQPADSGAEGVASAAMRACSAACRSQVPPPGLYDICEPLQRFLILGCPAGDPAADIRLSVVYRWTSRRATAASPARQLRGEVIAARLHDTLTAMDRHVADFSIPPGG